ncbi:hypothetical protein [Streptococcus equi]|uniref:hypothetical protein n=1 Tax=Streptococcus equi TaxID=1336 RepID=UPI0018A1EB1C|nr:hypothetical protein [Streptococcus equi]HEL1177927.1 hypothetical protein [Streptococcus equi subsp. zooepidemicus]HEL1235692.1 hypothetical protein [Streptococcus equi subsp. zooepidemicus]
MIGPIAASGYQIKQEHLLLQGAIKAITNTAPDRLSKARPLPAQLIDTITGLIQ